MCGGGPSAHSLRDEQTRLANIADIKAAQKARQGQINIIGGGETEEYRRSLATGAKDVGQSAEDIENLRMSDLFAANKGLARRRKRFRLIPEEFDINQRGGQGAPGTGGQGSSGAGGSGSSGAAGPGAPGGL